MTLAEIRDRLRALPTLLAKQTRLAELLAQSQEEVTNLLRAYEKEQRDVENLEKESFSNFVLRTVGRYDKKAEREIQEEVEAKARYDKALVHQRELERELARLTGAIRELESLSREYQSRLEEKRLELQGRLTQPQGQQLAKLEQERLWLLTQATEVNEASHAAMRALDTARQAYDSLDRADGWATWDVWGGRGILTHIAKYNHVDAAETAFNTLTTQLYRLRTELADVQGFSSPALSEISSTNRALDFWFDNIFTDLAVRNQIRDNASQLESLLHALETVQQSLHARGREIQIQLERNSRQQEDLLVGA